MYYVQLHHSFIRNYLPWLEGRVGRSHDTWLILIAHLYDSVYHISTISDTLCQGVYSDSVVRALDFYPGVRVRIQS